MRICTRARAKRGAGGGDCFQFGKRHKSVTSLSQVKIEGIPLVLPIIPQRQILLLVEFSQSRSPIFPRKHPQPIVIW